jgi:hypothetical protein
MAEENPQPEKTGERAPEAPQQQTGQQPGTPQGQSSGQRRNDRRDRPRHHGGRRDYHRHDKQAAPQPASPANPSDTTGNAEDIDGEEETEHDRSSPPDRRHYRGGRPPKKIIEEWANDPYCELVSQKKPATLPCRNKSSRPKLFFFQIVPLVSVGPGILLPGDLHSYSPIIPPAGLDIK